jgi:ribosomal protein S18 acetylase RimI-like enzyme
MGFLLAARQDDDLHIIELDVHPEFARRGIGAALIDHACGEARRRGLARVTLTTFADVPWNAPYYQRLGFRVLEKDALSATLRDTLAREAGNGLTNRVAMARPLADPA